MPWIDIDAAPETIVPSLETIRANSNSSAAAPNSLESEAEAIGFEPY
jgi:hypothetical protein